MVWRSLKKLKPNQPGRYGISRKSRRRVAVRGNLQKCPGVADPAEKALFSLLRRKYAPKMDFPLSGISKVGDTEFESDGEPDADRCSVALKDQLTGLRM